MVVGERKGLKIKNNLKFHILKYIYTYTNPPRQPLETVFIKHEKV